MVTVVSDTLPPLISSPHIAQHVHMHRIPHAHCKFIFPHENLNHQPIIIYQNRVVTPGEFVEVN